MAEALKTDPDKGGLHHFAGAPDVSWADFARAIFARAGMACRVCDIATAEYPTPAIRPLNSRLECSETESVLGLKRPDWRDDLGHMLNPAGELT
jgi:dTDP-4-dehydrorhamnose reductase